MNQLLNEIGGFHGNEGILVIGATNFADQLDPALTRAGRFDMKIQSREWGDVESSVAAEVRRPREANQNEGEEDDFRAGRRFGAPRDAARRRLRCTARTDGRGVNSARIRMQLLTRL